MQAEVRVHTEGAVEAIKAKLSSAFAGAIASARSDVQQIVGLAAEYSPLASGQMQEGIALFDDQGETTPGGEAHRFRFGLGRGLRSHEVRFERDGDVNVHTEVEQHFFVGPNGERIHCSHELVDEAGLHANANAQPRPLTRAMVQIWGPSMIPTNAKSFREGDVNVVEIEPLIPRVESSALMGRLEDAVRAGVAYG